MLGFFLNLQSGEGKKDELQKKNSLVSPILLFISLKKKKMVELTEKFVISKDPLASSEETALWLV